MKKSGQYSHNKIIEQLNTWMDWLETPNEDFGGMPVCPFLAPERNGIRTRMDAPCFITSITTHKSLGDAWKKIKGTKYWKKNRENA